MKKGHVKIPRSSSNSRVGVSVDGTLLVRDLEILGKEADAHLCTTFLRRVFALDEVKWVQIDREQSTAEICFDAVGASVSLTLERLAKSIQGDELESTSRCTLGVIPRDLSHAVGRIKISRFGSMLTTWEIVVDRPGRVRLRHRSMRGDQVLASRIHALVVDVPGVKDCTVRSLTGSVLVRFDPGVIHSDRLLQILELARYQGETEQDWSSHRGVGGFGLANTSLALSVTGEMVAPALLPACAILLLGSNLNTFRAAGQQLKHRQFGLPVLYATIVATTLASGQFIAAAAMSWMLTFWRRKSRDQMTHARRRLLKEIFGQPRYVRLALPRSTDLEIPIEHLKRHDVIVISSGEQIPADGVVIEGHGLAEERMVRGVTGLVRKQPDDRVFAGSTLEFGEIHIKVLCLGPQTQAAALARITVDAIAMSNGTQSLAGYGEMIAEPSVRPTLALAGLGLLVGDVTTAGAILRPDYATGPGLAFPLETIQAIALCLRHGIVIRDPLGIERLTTADLLIFDHHPTLAKTTLELESIEAFPGYDEEMLLRYAYAAFHNIADERASVLRAECNFRGIEVLDLRPTAFGTDITLIDQQSCIKVGDLGARGRASSIPRYDSISQRSQPVVPNSLMIGIDGRLAGLIHFGWSSQLELASALRRLCSKRKLQFGIVSDELASLVAPLATAIGADFCLASHSTEDRVQLLRSCRDRGFKVAYIGDGPIDPRLAAEAHITISLFANEISDLGKDHAPISMSRLQLVRLGELWDIAHIHHQRLNTAFHYAMIPNLLCVAGAFVWGFTSLTSVVVTNLATYGIYARTASSIRSLERQISKGSSDLRCSRSKKTLIQQNLDGVSYGADVF